MKKNTHKILSFLVVTLLIAALMVFRSDNTTPKNDASEVGVNVLSNPSFEGLGAPNPWDYPWFLAIQYGSTGTLSEDTLTFSDGFASARVGIGSSASVPSSVALVQNIFSTDA